MKQHTFYPVDVLCRLAGLLLVLYISTAGSASAQQVSGWSTLEWDASSQTFYGYAETDLDDYAALYYAAALNTYIFDTNGNVVAYAVTSRATDESWAEAEISASGTPGQTYTQHSEHLAIIQYYGGRSVERR